MWEEVIGWEGMVIGVFVNEKHTYFPSSVDQSLITFNQSPPTNLLYIYIQRSNQFSWLSLNPVHEI